MLKKSRDEFTVSEIKILQLLWEENISLAASEILEKLPDLNLFSTSIYVIVNGMIDKGLLVVDGKVKRGKRHARTYKPAISQEDFATQEALKLTANLPKNKRLFNLITAMVDHEGIDKETLNAIDEFLQKKRKELNS
jgi:predicted transcriptional regulator